MLRGAWHVADTGKSLCFLKIFLRILFHSFSRLHTQSPSPIFSGGLLHPPLRPSFPLAWYLLPGPQ